MPPAWCAPVLSVLTSATCVAGPGGGQFDATGTTVLFDAVRVVSMVATTQRDGATWYECEKCGLLFDDESDAAAHEDHCDPDEPSYIQ
jgi:hypothetical protein